MEGGGWSLGDGTDSWMFGHWDVCPFVRLYVLMFGRLYVCTFVRLYICTFVRLYVCMFVCLYVRSYGQTEIPPSVLLDIVPFGSTAQKETFNRCIEAKSSDNK